MIKVKISLSTYRKAPLWLIPLVLAIVVMFMPYYLPDPGVLRVVISIALLALLVVGVNVTFGYAGELALGQAAIYAAGAYVAGYFAVQGLDLPITLVIGVLAAVAVGLVTGIPGVRLGSWSLGMVTFFIVLLIPDFVALFPAITGGPAGLTGIPLPSVFGIPLTDNGYFILVIVVCIVFFALLRNYVTSRHGVALKVVRESPILARSLGYSVSRLKVTAYIIGALPAGAAGCLFGYQSGYISPVSFNFTLAAAILAASIIGGSSSIYGAIVGATIMTLVPLSSTGVQQYSLILYGVLLVLGGLFFRGGVAGIANSLIRTRLLSQEVLLDVETIMSAPPTVERLGGEALIVQSLSKRFGGNRALNDVSLTAKAGQVTALIGPNGSGKTTLLNIVSGFYPSDSGAIMVGERALIGLRAHRIAAQGVARTFQTPLIPRELTVAEVVASSRFRRVPTSVFSAMVRLPGSQRAARADRERALSLLAMMGIAELADRPASELPLGTRRILEVARAFASDPRVVLLDEPASGLDEMEVLDLAKVIAQLRSAGATIVLVEHNFEMVMSLADQVHVLHLGQIIASGPPELVRNDPAVLESYLGKAAAQAERKRREEAAR